MLFRSRVCDRLIIFAKNGAEYFDGGYDLFLEKVGWEDQGEFGKAKERNHLGGEEQEEKIKAAPKSNRNENKKLKAELVRERNKLTSPLKKKVDKLEKAIMKTEELLEQNHEQLIEISNSGDSSKLMELSKLVSTQENEVEENFELLEVVQNELDEIESGYEQKILELD